MPAHHSEREKERHDAWLRSESMALSEKLRQVQAELNDAKRRLDLLERTLAPAPESARSDVGDAKG